MVAIVASVRPIATAMPGTHASGMPALSSGPSISCAIAGSARNPMIRLVTVTPTWAPESCVDRDLSAIRTPAAERSPSATARSTAARSTVTSEYSAAPKTPHVSIRAIDTPSSTHSMPAIVADVRDSPDCRCPVGELCTSGSGNHPTRPLR